jgi:hypothetical protein
LPRQAKLEGESTRLLSIDEVDSRLKALRHAVNLSTGGRVTDYDPLIEMAKFANNDQIDQKIRIGLHKDLAEFIYPKVRTLDFSNPDGRKMKITIEIEGYAQKEKPVEAEYTKLEDHTNGEG